MFPSSFITICRIGVDDALRHPFLCQLHARMDEPSCSRLFDGSFENSLKSVNCIRDMMMEEIQQVHESEK